MSWTRDTDGDLINLDFCDLIEICLDEESKEDEYQVIAWSGERPYILWIGTEQRCMEITDNIARKLSFISLPIVLKNN